MWPSDEKEIMRLLRENNAMLKQILQIFASSGNSVANNFLLDVLANLTADGISKG